MKNIYHCHIEMWNSDNSTVYQILKWLGYQVVYIIEFQGSKMRKMGKNNSIFIRPCTFSYVLLFLFLMLYYQNLNKTNTIKFWYFNLKYLYIYIYKAPNKIKSYIFKKQTKCQIINNTAVYHNINHTGLCIAAGLA